jgi:hypothetical protein
VCCRGARPIKDFTWADLVVKLSAELGYDLQAAE